MVLANNDAPKFDKSIVCGLLDKLTLKQLRLMEEKMQCELNIEANINNGSIHFAKSRYILGQSAVSATCLPTDSSPEFSASTVCESIEEDGVQKMKIVKNDAEDTVNPMKWFGVLVPRNMHKAQMLFQNAINCVIECVNVQLSLHDVMNKIDLLNKVKNLNK